MPNFKQWRFIGLIERTHSQIQVCIVLHMCSSVASLGSKNGHTMQGNSSIGSSIDKNLSVRIDVIAVATICNVCGCYDAICTDILFK